MTRVRTLRGSTSLPAGPAHLQAWCGPMKKASGFIWAYIRSDITQPELHNFSGRQQSIQDHFLSVQRSFSKPSNAPTRKPSGACYSRATYNWTSWSLWFTDLTALPNHSQILNVVTPLYQCGQFRMVVDISAWRSYNQAARAKRLQGDHNVCIMQLCRFKISAPTKTTQAGINISPPSRRGSDQITETLAVRIWL